MRTYQTLFKDEVRAVELTIRDETGTLYTPSAGYSQIFDEDGNQITTQQGTYITTGKIYTIVDTNTTANIGKYKIVWSLLNYGYTYYHATELTVVEL